MSYGFEDWEKTPGGSFINDYCEARFTGDHLIIQTEDCFGNVIMTHLPFMVIVELLCQRGYSVRESGQ